MTYTAVGLLLNHWLSVVNEKGKKGDLQMLPGRV